MNLLADIGNQYLKWSLGGTSGAFRSSLSGLESNFVEQLHGLNNVTDVYFVNVTGPEMSDRFCELAQSSWNITPYQVVPAMEQCGVSNGYRQIGQLGADRWAAAIGAWHITNTATIIVDCGTAVTVDALSASAEFIGGSIIPGIQLAHESLYKRAPGIGKASVLVPTIPARSTIEAISTGVVFAAVGGIEMLIDRYRRIIGDSSRLLITGGDAILIQKHSTKTFEYIPNLVLKGLSQIADSTTISDTASNTTILS